VWLPQAFQWIRDFTDRPMTTRQAVLANVAKNVVDTDAGTYGSRRRLRCLKLFQPYRSCKFLLLFHPANAAVL
jgi:hypothetical protein